MPSTFLPLHSSKLIHPFSYRKLSFQSSISLDFDLFSVSDPFIIPLPNSSSLDWSSQHHKSHQATLKTFWMTILASSTLSTMLLASYLVQLQDGALKTLSWPVYPLIVQVAVFAGYTWPLISSILGLLYLTVSLDDIKSGSWRMKGSRKTYVDRHALACGVLTLLSLLAREVESLACERQLGPGMECSIVVGGLTAAFLSGVWVMELKSLDAKAKLDFKHQ